MALIRNLILAATATWGLSSCSVSSAFACTNADDCNGEPGGSCGPAGFCAFPDETCASGARYGEHAGGNSGKCVAETDTGTTTAESLGTGGSGSSSGSGDPTTPQTDGPGTTTTGTSTSTTSNTTSPTGTSTSSSMCSESGEACGSVEDCCNGCLGCVDSVCVPRTGDSEPCPECQVCDATAQCAIDEGAVCGGPEVDCTQVIHGRVGGNCFAGTGTVGPVCDAIGQCIAARPDGCIDRGEAIVSCSEACLDNPAACAPGASIDTVSTDVMCKTNEDEAQCGNGCEVGVEGWQFTNNWCGPEGQCETATVEQCGLYICTLAGCRATCVSDPQCFNSTCQLNECCQGVCF